MTKYDISLLGYTRSVLVLRADEPIPDPIPFGSVCILPLPTADGVILSSGLDSSELCMLLSFFYARLLGYPKTTLELKNGSNSIELEIFDTPPHLCGVKLPKCKLLYTNLHTMPDLTEHTVHTVSAAGICRVIPVMDADGFRPSVLPSLRFISGLPTARAAVALSGGTVIFSDGIPPTPSLIAAAAVTHRDFSSGSVTLVAKSVEYTVTDLPDSTAVFTPARLISKINI